MFGFRRNSKSSARDHVVVVQFYLHVDDDKMTTRVFGPMTCQSARIVTTVLSGHFISDHRIEPVRIRDTSEGLY